MRPTLLALTALAMGSSVLLGQQVSPAEWGVCSAEEDSLKRLVCYDELTAQASSAEWNECATEASIARLKCYDDLASELSTGKWRACAETDDSLERLVCYDELAREVSSADLRACAETDDSLVRLVCYDDLAGGTEPPPAPRPAEAPESAVAPEPAPLLDQPPVTTGWQLEKNVDPTSNRTTWIARLTADKRESSINSHAVLALRCQDGELEIMASVSELLDDGAVVMLFDENVPKNESWDTSTDRRFVFAREHQMLWFLQQLQSSRRLAIGVTAQPNVGRVAVFHLNTVETRDVLDSIREGCPTVGRRRNTEW